MVQSILYESGPDGAKVFSDDRIRTFYLNLLHLEGLLYPHLDAKYWEKMPPIKDHLFKNRKNIRQDPIGYFIKCQEWFAGLMVTSHNAGFTNIETTTNALDQDEDDEDAQEN